MPHGIRETDGITWVQHPLRYAALIGGSVLPTDGKRRATRAIVKSVAKPPARVVTEHPATMHTGPLGSTIHVLHADPQTVVELASIDWNRSFRPRLPRPGARLITLMTPSRLHDELVRILDHVVDIAASTLTRRCEGLLTARLREPGFPPGTGMEPDCAFYVGDKARAYRDALAAGKEAADAFFDENAPDLVVEVEITNADEGKIERYADMGVRELWLLQDPAGSAFRARSSSPSVPGPRRNGSPPPASSGI